MAKTTIKLKMRSSNGNDLTTTVGYANPSATNAVLAAYGKKLCSLTSNTFVDVVRVNEDSIGNADEE